MEGELGETTSDIRVVARHGYGACSELDRSWMWVPEAREGIVLGGVWGAGLLLRGWTQLLYGSGLEFGFLSPFEVSRWWRRPDGSAPKINLTARKFAPRYEYLRTSYLAFFGSTPHSHAQTTGALNELSLSPTRTLSFVEHELPLQSHAVSALRSKWPQSSFVGAAD